VFACLFSLAWSIPCPRGTFIAKGGNGKVYHLYDQHLAADSPSTVVKIFGNAEAFATEIAIAERFSAAFGKEKHAIGLIPDIERCDEERRFRMPLALPISGDGASLRDRIVISFELLNTLQRIYCHLIEKNWFYYDLKPANIMRNSDSTRIRLIDIGGFEVFTDPKTLMFGGVTPGFAPPDFYVNDPPLYLPATKADRKKTAAFIIGMTIAVYLTGRNPMQILDLEGLHFFGVVYKYTSAFDDADAAGAMETLFANAFVPLETELIDDAVLLQVLGTLKATLISFTRFRPATRGTIDDKFCKHHRVGMKLPPADVLLGLAQGHE
jgi:serine/threonine protein kinase